MSQFSGKADVADHIYMHSGEDERTELDLFNEFKEATGGVIYQHVPVKITKFNIDALIEQDKKKYHDNYDKCQDIVLRKAEDGKGFYHWGKYYKSLSALSKNDTYWFRREIHFDRMIDLVKYYPYTIAMMYSEKLDNGKTKQYVEIGPESFVEREREEHYEYGWDYEDSFLDHYDKELLEEYERVARGEYENKKKV